MGASGWDYVVPYGSDVDQVLRDLQRRIFDEEDFYKGYNDEWDVGSFEELLSCKDTDEFWEEGTHSILDIDRIIGTDELDSAGAVRELTTDEARSRLGTDRPTRPDFERVYDDLMVNTDFPRWSGRYVVLYEDGKPHEIAFWGYSGD